MVREYRERVQPHIKFRKSGPTLKFLKKKKKYRKKGQTEKSKKKGYRLGEGYRLERKRLGDQYSRKLFSLLRRGLAATGARLGRYQLKGPRSPNFSRTSKTVHGQSIVTLSGLGKRKKKKSDTEKGGGKNAGGK